MLKNKSVIFSFIVIAFSIWSYFESFNFSDRAARWPRTIILFTILFCLLLIIGEAIKFLKGIKAEEGDSFSHLSWFVPSLIITTIGFIYIIPRLGFFISTFLFMVTGMYILGIRDSKKFILAPIIIVIFIYIVFKMILNLPLPQGIFF